MNNWQDGPWLIKARTFDPEWVERDVEWAKSQDEDGTNLVGFWTSYTISVHVTQDGTRYRWRPFVAYAEDETLEVFGPNGKGSRFMTPGDLRMEIHRGAIVPPVVVQMKGYEVRNVIVGTMSRPDNIFGESE